MKDYKFHNSLFKWLFKKAPFLVKTRPPKRATILYNESKHNIHALVGNANKVERDRNHPNCELWLVTLLLSLLWTTSPPSYSPTHFTLCFGMYLIWTLANCLELWRILLWTLKYYSVELWRILFWTLKYYSFELWRILFWTSMYYSFELWRILLWTLKYSSFDLWRILLWTLKYYIELWRILLWALKYIALNFEVL